VEQHRHELRYASLLREKQGFVYETVRLEQNHSDLLYEELKSQKTREKN